MLKSIFTWWNGATIGARFDIGRRAGYVGTDTTGNKYYEERRPSLEGRKRRYVIYNGYAEPSKVPADWHGWLHHTYDKPPTVDPLPRRAWEIEHKPNLTGTIDAYRPKGSLAEGGERAKSTGDYEFLETLMRESLFETLVGLAVIVVAGFFLVFSLSQQSGASTGDTYALMGKFGRADGVSPGTDVRIAGVKVGAVTSVDVDPKTMKAIVKMNVRKDITLPVDSTAQIQSDSLLGGSYIYVLGGGDPDENLPTDGTGVFDYTRGTVDIMSLLLEAVGNASGGGDKGGDAKAEEAPL